jgi:outer membrane protein OmpA-like peptidoglycan-associated protein
MQKRWHSPCLHQNEIFDELPSGSPERPGYDVDVKGPVMQKDGLGLVAVAVLFASCSPSSSMKARVTAVEQRVNQLETTSTQQQIDSVELRQELQSTRGQAAAATQLAQIAHDLASGSFRKEEVRRVTLYFDHSSSTVNGESQKMLDGVVDELLANPMTAACVIGYTDASGDPKFNDWLATRRAERVRQVLVSRLGTDVLRVASIGLGATRPIADNETTDGRRQNRRVEVSLVRPAAMAEQVTQNNR